MLVFSLECELERRHFSDGERYLNIVSQVDQLDLVVLCPLHQPNEKLIDLMLFSETARQQGAIIDFKHERLQSVAARYEQ
ncbi:MAG: ribose-phosphate pyrophosphokinase [Oleispira sp.]|jgi:ribose-phosphate pyrophosphokinase